MLESGQEVTLAIKEGGVRERAITFPAFWQGVRWCSVAASAEGVQIAQHRGWPSAFLLLCSAPDRQIFIQEILI